MNVLIETQKSDFESDGKKGRGARKKLVYKYTDEKHVESEEDTEQDTAGTEETKTTPKEDMAKTNPKKDTAETTSEKDTAKTKGKGKSIRQKGYRGKENRPPLPSMDM